MIIIKITNIERETEKAVNVNVLYLLRDTIKTWSTWLPKSRIKMVDENHIEIEDWLVRRISEDMEKCDNYYISECARLNNVQFSNF